MRVDKGGSAKERTDCDLDRRTGGVHTELWDLSQYAVVVESRRCGQEGAKGAVSRLRRVRAWSSVSRPLGAPYDTMTFGP